MIQSPKWSLPDMPFEYDSKQADSIMRAMVLNYRMEDVLCCVSDKEWFKALSDEEQQKALERIAYAVEEMIGDYDDYWTFAVEESVKEYKEHYIKE